MKTIYTDGIFFPNASEAIQHMDASGYGDKVVSIKGDRRYFLTTEAEADRLDAQGLVTAYWFDRDGVLISVPTE
jgi:hypothetical protein